MKSYFVKNGGGLASLTLKEQDIPVPGPHEVLLRVRASSFNYREQAILQGIYPLPIKEPEVIPLADGAGEIVAVGPGVTRARVGDRAVINSLVKWIDGPFTSWEEQGKQLSGSLDGFLTEYALLSEETVLPLPEHLSYEEAATLPIAALTAWNALERESLPQAGDTILPLGTGGGSLFALQFAKAAGARVIATTTSADKVERLRALGADAVINTRTTPNWSEAVRELTNGRGVDLVMESTMPASLEQSIKATAVSGQVSLIGWLPSDVSSIDIGTFFFNVVNLRPIFTGSRAQFEAMNKFIAKHRIRPIIDRVFPFAEARAAYEYNEKGRAFGKVVISQN
ncbi:NAD(P)-dependent alcohol dehydrogenase [Ktedonosporobacter rubrisoli]|uniref:NAD(P)-dependent alcohol dehydrogenase n=1 Tax=Ktedonosporobacter rubrisoli TaxID=2509675 RepID=A0A4P6JK56_KTERU|nr:NAD(P)-dependent alcohol dehydrogenase [Ktedonosporobacter rubrisoli]QBD75433.1 NAD(P)-dependent alcohol dehydrogenase [Ktedonosporobacter rubrisoli]